MKNASTRFYLYLSTLITQARLKKGYATLRELYREHNPSIDYQTWASAESGRRIPSAKAVTLIGDILDIEREALIVAYCKDKFDDPKSLSTLDTLQHKNFINLDTVMEAKDHERSSNYAFSTEQLIAMKNDPRLRLFLTLTYDKSPKTTFDRLAKYFDINLSEVREVIAVLQKMGLVEVDGEEIKKIHLHSSIPDTPDFFQLRREILLRSLDLSLKPDSFISNYFVNLSEESYKRVLAFLEFIGANLVKMAKDDEKKENIFRVQIALTGNKLSVWNASDQDKK